MSLGDLIVAPHHTALSVEDFEAARDFFVSVLGFDLEGEMDRRTDIAPVVALPDACVRWAMLNRGGYRLELFKYYSPAGERPAESWLTQQIQYDLAQAEAKRRSMRVKRLAAA